MSLPAQLALIAAAACLLGATLAALTDLLASKGDRRVAVQGFSGTAMALLCLFLALEWLRMGRLPTGSTAQVLAWIAVGSLAIHLACIASLHIRALGTFLLPIAAACALAAPLAGDHPWAGRIHAGTPWGLIHGLSALAGMTAFAAAFATGALYLIQAARLKTRPLQAGRLPSLDTLDRLNLMSLVTALAAWTLALVAGALQAQASWGPDWASTPLVLVSGATWLTLSGVTAARMTATMRGPKVAWLSVAGFALAVAALIAGHP